MLVMAMVLKIRAAVLLLVLRSSAPARANKARMTGYLKNTALWAMTENSTLKAQPANCAYSHLEKRMGSGDTPPKTADEYAPKVEVEGFKWDEFKADPRMQSFMKSAHAKGITNDQMGFILGEYAQLAPELVNGAAALDSEAAATQLRETWKTDAEFNKNIGLAFRAFNSLADDSDKGRMDEIGNNPMVIRMLAKIGAEMQEDAPAGGDVNLEEQQSIRDLMKSPAYMDPKHADHENVSARVRAYYQKRYGDQTVA